MYLIAVENLLRELLLFAKKMNLAFWPLMTFVGGQGQLKSDSLVLVQPLHIFHMDLISSS